MQTDVTLLGKAVRYVRHNGAEVSEGHGVVQALFLDPSKRVGVRMADAKGNQFNVELAALNPTPEFVEQFRAGMQNVLDTSKTYNDRSQVEVEEGNRLVEDIYTSFIGAPVDVEVLAVEDDANAQSTKH